MKKLLALFIAGVVVLSGCSSIQPAEDEVMTEEQDTEETQELEEEIENPPAAEAPTAEAPTTEASAETESAEIAEIVLAKCITEAGAKLYTASWCGHCKNQKEAFKEGAEYLDNTECAEDDGWADACTDAGVKAVPTWIFADGTVKTGNTPLSKLAELTDCTYNI
jgi:hypothetical protein